MTPVSRTCPASKIFKTYVLYLRKGNLSFQPLLNPCIPQKDHTTEARWRLRGYENPPSSRPQRLCDKSCLPSGKRINNRIIWQKSLRIFLNLSNHQHLCLNYGELRRVGVLVPSRWIGCLSLTLIRSTEVQGISIVGSTNRGMSLAGGKDRLGNVAWRF